MPYYNKWDDRTIIRVYSPITQNINKRPICEDCLDHPQGDPNWDGSLDCKNLFEKDGNTHYTQCCCWSPVHGVREENKYKEFKDLKVE